MDLVRARAIPALIALCLLAPPAVASDCSVDGTYQFRSEASKDDTDTFNRLVLLKQGENLKLYKYDGPKEVHGFGGTELRSRPKSTALAARAEVAGSRVRFLDSAGKLLTEGTLDSGGKWTCKGDRLERSSENYTGVGNEIRTERLEESLRRDGDVLVYANTRTTIDPPGGKPRSSQIRFRSAR